MRKNKNIKEKIFVFPMEMEFFTIKYSGKTKSGKVIQYIEYKSNKYNIHIDKFKRHNYNNW